MQLDKPDDVDAVINDFCPRTQMDYKLAKNLERINECFDAGSVEEILAKLEKDGSEWAERTFKAKLFSKKIRKIFSCHTVI